MYIYICVYIRACIYIHKCMSTHYIYINIYMHIYMYAYIRIRTMIQNCQLKKMRNLSRMSSNFSNAVAILTCHIRGNSALSKGARLCRFLFQKATWQFRGATNPRHHRIQQANTWDSHSLTAGGAVGNAVCCSMVKCVAVCCALQ